MQKSVAPGLSAATGWCSPTTYRLQLREPGRGVAWRHLVEFPPGRNRAGAARLRAGCSTIERWKGFERRLLREASCQKLVRCAPPTARPAASVHPTQKTCLRPRWVEFPAHFPKPVSVGAPPCHAAQEISFPALAPADPAAARRAGPLSRSR